MKQVIISVIFVFGFAAVGFGAVDGKSSSEHQESTTAIDRAKLYRTYRQCSDEAVRRFLSQDEVLGCSAVYLQLKLSFLEDVSLEDYAELSAVERARANSEGYRAYQEWVQWRVIGLK